MFEGKKIIVGITGSIAAYKAAILVRLLIKEGAEVKVVMTETAKKFVAPLTFATLCKNPVPVEFFNPENGEWNSHVKLGEWADCLIIAPATAGTIAKMATGIADNLLLTTYLSARCPVFVAPAMDLRMYSHPTVQYNLETLKSYGNRIIEPVEGELASGLEGKGRMETPDMIVEELRQYFTRTRSLMGQRFLVTAGPTIEPIDPVRFISNHSSGKMGYAIAQELLDRGAYVILVSGKTELRPPEGAHFVDVTTAEEMYQAAITIFESCNGAVMCAAVADYTPVEVPDEKIKSGDGINLELKPTKDIAAALGEVKGGKILIGFALETANGEENAMAKMDKKNLDMIVLNSLRDRGAGFGGDTNKVTVIFRDGAKSVYPVKSKAQVAEDIVSEMETLLKK